MYQQRTRILAIVLAASAAATLLPVTSAAQGKTEQPELVSSTSNAEADRLIARYVAMKNARDASRTSEIYRDDYQERSGRNPSGLHALTENWKQQFAAIPDVQVAVQDVVANGNKVVARFVYTGTHTVPFFAGIPATGRKFSFTTIDIWRVEGGKFVEHWDVVDFAGLQRQLAAPAAKQ